MGIHMDTHFFGFRNRVTTVTEVEMCITVPNI